VLLGAGAAVGASVWMIRGADGMSATCDLRSPVTLCACPVGALDLDELRERAVKGAVI
jgi:hypothetical protein